MGANPYYYFTPYAADTRAALEELRQREFAAGRYDPALEAADPPTYTFEQSFPPGPTFPSPGAQHASIEEALEAAEESGTGSILDIVGISSTPDFLHASPITDADLISLFGSATPTRDDIRGVLLREQTTPAAAQETWMKREAFWDQIERGHARYIVVQEEGVPSELFFAGYSID